MYHKTHGHTAKGASDRQVRTYRAWRAMKDRCRNPQYVNHCGRGISVCKRWLRFENFLTDMGSKPRGLTLDRIESDGDYEPGNCRWATYSQQNARHERQWALSSVNDIAQRLGLTLRQNKRWIETHDQRERTTPMERVRLRINDDPNRTMKLREVASYLQIRPRTVWAWTKRGILPKPVRLPNVTLWLFKDIQKALEARRRS